MVVAHLLPVAAFGDLALILALGAIFGIATDMGLTIVLAQTVAAEPSCGARALRLVVGRRLVAGVVASAVVALAYVTVASDRSLWVPLVFSVSILATTVYTSANAALRAAGQVAPEAVNEVVSRIAVLALGGVWLARGGGLLAAVAAYALADTASAAILAVTAHHRLSGAAPTPAARAHFAMRQVAPLAVFTLLATVYYRLNVWLLALLKDSSTVAHYAAAYRLLDGLLIPAGALAAIVDRV